MPVETPDHWKPTRRDRLAWRIANAALRIATPGYRKRLEGTYRLGLTAAAQPVQITHTRTTNGAAFPFLNISGNWMGAD